MAEADPKAGLAADARWELLLEAVVGMGADVPLDDLLTRIVSTAGALAHARFVALGVLDLGHERRLRTFIHQGMDSETVRGIGDLPEGHGLLGLLIDQPEPVRLHDIATHPASYGFPPGHPPMRSFLGVPVRTRGKVFGNLYLTEREGGGDFTAEDERIVTALAGAAGVAIENAQLYDELRQRERWLEATAQITTTLVAYDGGPEPLRLVVDRAREVSGADVAWIVSGDVDTPDDLVIQVVSGIHVDLAGLRQLPTKHSLAAEVATRGVPLLVEDLTTEPRALADGAVRGWPELGPVLLVPLRARSGFKGVLALGWTPEHAPRQQGLDPALPASFAEQAALTLQVARTQAQRERLSLLEDRDRIARDLHDVVIQRLFALGLTLESASRRSTSSEVQERLGTAVDELDGTIRDIRSTIFGLSSGGADTEVKAEVTRLVDRAAATLKFRPSLAFSGAIETLVDADAAADLVAVLTELLSNTARHAHATVVSVSLSAARDIELVVTDNGRGLAAEVRESGLSNIRARAEGRGGACTIEPRDDGTGTRVRWVIPTRLDGSG